jgi:hypothetical protein
MKRFSSFTKNVCRDKLKYYNKEILLKDILKDYYIMKTNP